MPEALIYHLHGKGKVSPFSIPWPNLVRIALEILYALSYMY